CAPRRLAPTVNRGATVSRRFGQKQGRHPASQVSKILCLGGGEDRGELSRRHGYLAAERPRPHIEVTQARVRIRRVTAFYKDRARGGRHSRVAQRSNFGRTTRDARYQHKPGGRATRASRGRTQALEMSQRKRVVQFARRSEKLLRSIEAETHHRILFRKRP